MHYTPEEEDRVRAEIDAAKARRWSASAPSETACQPRSLDVATCSLPVSSVDDAVFMLSYAARMADELKRPDVANRMLSIAATLRFRADAARATERQPEENNLDQTRGGQRSA